MSRPLSRSLTGPFLACLVLGGLLPISFGWLPADVQPLVMGPSVHASLSAIALGIYAMVVFTTLRNRESRVTDPGNEASDSVYFLGFLQTMSVLARAFLPGGDQGSETLFRAVGLGVLLTLAGLAIRVFFTLYFESEADVLGSQPVTSATGAGQRPSPARLLSDDQLGQIDRNVSRLSETTVEMAERITKLVAAMNSPINALLDDTQKLITNVSAGSDAIATASKQMQDVLEKSFADTSNRFSASAAQFDQNVAESARTLQGVLSEWQTFQQSISQNLKSTTVMTSRLEGLATQQLQGFEQVVERLVGLSRQVQDSVDAIPNPTAVLTESLQKLTSATGVLAQSLEASRVSASASAEQLQRVSDSANAVAPTLQQIPPSVQAATAHLQEELKAMNDLLDEFTKLSRRRIEGSVR